MATDSIQPGDRVLLKSGGPEMTVSKVINDSWYCQWFDKGELKGASFPTHVLKKIG